MSATFWADRLLGYRRRCGPGAVALVGAGQLAMHLGLSGSLVGHASPESLGLGLTCGLVVSHAGATAAIVSMLLGLQRAVELPIALATRAAAWLWAHLMPIVAPPAEEGPGAVPASDGSVPRAVRCERFGLVDRRRGPPTALVVAG